MHKQLTLEQRHYINIASKSNRSMRSIAKDLNVSHTTISREIKRNSGKRGYRFNQADGFARQRHQAKDKFVKLNDDCKIIIGKAHKGATVTLDERISKLRLAYPVHSKHKDKVTTAIGILLKPIEDYVHSITYDNGKEFAGHEQVNKAIGCKSYFAKPYHSWERGQNENANGLLRQYFPKSMSLIDIAIDDVKIAVDKLNSRPRKCLGFKTPYQVFLEMTGVDASQLEVVRL